MNIISYIQQITTVLVTPNLSNLNLGASDPGYHVGSLPSVARGFLLCRDCSPVPRSKHFNTQEFSQNPKTLEKTGKTETQHELCYAPEKTRQRHLQGGPLLGL